MGFLVLPEILKHDPHLYIYCWDLKYQSGKKYLPFKDDSLETTVQILFSPIPLNLLHLNFLVLQKITIDK